MKVNSVYKTTKQQGEAWITFNTLVSINVH